MYGFINIFFKHVYTFLITIPLVPIILLIESRQNLLAAAFALFYFKKIFTDNNYEFIPLSLLTSICISRTFLPLIVIHFLYNLFLKKNLKNKVKYENTLILKIFLISFFLFSLTQQSNSKFNNHMLYDETYAPKINLNNPLEIGFFQFNNQAINDKKNKSKEDWFITFSENYSENNTILKVFVNQPKILLDHIIGNIPKLVFASSMKTYGYLQFYLNKYIKVFLILFFTIFSIIGLVNLYKKHNIKPLIPTILYVLIFFLTLLISNPTSRYLSLIMPLLIIPFYISIEIILKKKFFYFLIFFILISGYFNFKYYFDYTKKLFVETAEIQNFLKELENEKKTILTNEKHLLITINNKNKKYIGFDSLPPFFDQKVFNEILKTDLIIFTDTAKNFDDISTKQGQKYYTYIEPNINKNHKIKKLGNFYIIQK